MRGSEREELQMKRGLAAIAMGMLLLAGCNQQSPQKSESNLAQPVTPPPSEVPPAIPPPATGPDAKTPLAEPKGAIDPKSVEAAGQVVQHYGALIEQRRMKEAQALWGSSESASAFELQLKRYPEAHLEIGKPGDTEGAAGSIYATMPVVFYGRDQNGTDFRRAADVILRRVNDVPGSTEAQRRWHIERIDWKNSA
jgi:hypothetical protein